MSNIVVTARECTRAIAEDRVAHAGSGALSRAAARARAALDVAQVELRMALLQAAAWVPSWLGRRGAKGPALEQPAPVVAGSPLAA